MIKQIVKDATVVLAPGEVTLERGVTVPNSINLHAMAELVAEGVPQVKSHLFFAKDNCIATIHPDDRKITTMID